MRPRLNAVLESDQTQRVWLKERQTALFDPLALWGLAYWYGVWPLHQLVFARMLRGIARAAEERDEDTL
jgi:hypothetical protein